MNNHFKELSVKYVKSSFKVKQIIHLNNNAHPNQTYIVIINWISTVFSIIIISIQPSIYASTYVYITFIWIKVPIL